MPHSSKRIDNAMAKSKKDKKKNNVPRSATQVLQKGRQFLPPVIYIMVSCNIIA
jgi:hypothetical protein